MLKPAIFAARFSGNLVIRYKSQALVDNVNQGEFSGNLVRYKTFFFREVRYKTQVLSMM
jgi:hypothetical protein